MRILLDQNLPQRIGHYLAGHQVAHAYRLGWSELANGELPLAAEEAGFDLFLTADKNIR